MVIPHVGGTMYEHLTWPSRSMDTDITSYITTLNNHEGGTRYEPLTKLNPLRYTDSTSDTLYTK